MSREGSRTTLTFLGAGSAKMLPPENIMNISRNALAVAIVVLIATPIALAQDAKNGPKLYRWVGPDGKAHYSDDLPPEALNQARQELSAKSGITLKQVDRALTAEEHVAAQTKADADAKADEAIQKAKQSDQVLLSSYPSEAELKRAYDDRIQQQAESLKTIRIGMDSQQQNLTSLLNAASNLELSGKPVTSDLAKSVAIAHEQMLRQQQSQMRLEAQSASLRLEGEAVIARYRSLRAAAEAARASTTPAMPPPSSSPKG